MFEVLATDVYVKWFASLRDQTTKARIVTRILYLGDGNFGDTKPVGSDVQELRLHFGPGYRVYFTRRGERIILLLCGGDKGSQQRDIARAKRIEVELE